MVMLKCLSMFLTLDQLDVHCVVQSIVDVLFREKVGACERFTFFLTSVLVFACECTKVRVVY